MSEFAVALTAFLVAHTIPASPRLCTRFIGLLGRGPYLTGYSLLSVALLVWLVVAVRRADTVKLWAASAWQWHVPLLVMPWALFLLVAGLSAANPLSVSLRSATEPGPITAVTRHPVLWGVPPLGPGPRSAQRRLGVRRLLWHHGRLRGRRHASSRHQGAPAPRTTVLERHEPEHVVRSLRGLLGGRARGDGLHRLALPAAAAGLLYAWILLQGHALLIGPEPLASLRAFD